MAAILKLVNRVCDAKSERREVEETVSIRSRHDHRIGKHLSRHLRQIFFTQVLPRDTLAGKAGEKGESTMIAYEFVVQALIVYEEMANSK